MDYRKSTWGTLVIILSFTPFFSFIFFSHHVHHYPFLRPSLKSHSLSPQAIISPIPTACIRGSAAYRLNQAHPELYHCSTKMSNSYLDYLGFDFIPYLVSTPSFSIEDWEVMCEIARKLVEINRPEEKGRLHLPDEWRSAYFVM